MTHPNYRSHQIEFELQRMLPRVEKPARYVGGELNSTVKDWSEVSGARIALAFPDIYDLGMPNHGLAILYDRINKQPDLLAERVYLPGVDMEALMRERGLPLFSLESRRPVCDFDVLGVSIPYETTYTNVLSLLDLAGIPLRVSDRSAQDPLVIAGGHATFNPEPVWAFVDAFVLGEGEEALLEVARCVAGLKRDYADRGTIHRQLSRIDGVYVPSLYHSEYETDGTLSRTTPIAAGIPGRVRKRIVAALPPPLTDFLVPNIETVHDRVVVEITRGCTRGCRFCHAGIVTRPVRERGVDEIVDAIEEALAKTGFTEVGLLSLSSSDYSHVVELVQAVQERMGNRRVSISLPSLRIESVSVELMQALQCGSRRGGFTLAPEAASERMREIINKPVSTRQVLDTAAEVYGRGWPVIKLYFMIGHPEETLEDVEAIADLCQEVLAEGRKALGGRARLNVGVSTFVPKPHTPFQWVPCDTPEQIRDKQTLLRSRLRARAIKLSWTHPNETMLEASLSRGDRRLSDVVLKAWELGARRDAWQEHFRFDLWQQAFEHCGVDPSFYTHRPRGEDEALPWDHLDCGVDRAFLYQDYLWSRSGQTRADCRDRCYACGILPGYKELRGQTPEADWKCPDGAPR